MLVELSVVDQRYRLCWKFSRKVPPLRRWRAGMSGRRCISRVTQETKSPDIPGRSYPWLDRHLGHPDDSPCHMGRKKPRIKPSSKSVTIDSDRTASTAGMPPRR